MHVFLRWHCIVMEHFSATRSAYSADQGKEVRFLDGAEVGQGVRQHTKYRAQSVASIVMTTRFLRGRARAAVLHRI